MYDNSLEVDLVCPSVRLVGLGNSKGATVAVVRDRTIDSFPRVLLPGMAQQLARNCSRRPPVYWCAPESRLPLAFDMQLPNVEALAG